MKETIHKLKEKFVGANCVRPHFEEITKNQKGITLIALIITIIVMMILVAVTVTFTIGENGILAQAKESAKLAEKAQLHEQIMGAMKLTNEGKIVIGDSYDAAKKMLTMQGYEVGDLNEEDGTFEVTGKKGTYTYKITETEITVEEFEGVDKEETIGIATVGTIAQKNSTINGAAYSSTNPIIPAGFAPINITTTGQEASWTAEGGPQVNNGLVITDNVTQDASGKATIGSEFVWIPVEEINDMIMCQEHGASVSLDEITLQCPTCGENTLLAGKLYTDLNISAAGFDSSSTGQTYKNTMLREPYLVSKDSNYNITNTQLQNEFDDMAKSVAKYGGFYVGRYEISLTEEKTAQSKYGEISSNASQEDTLMWYGLYAKAKTYENAKNSVQSTMIWGSQYDAMMIWMANGDDSNVVTEIGDNRNKNRETGTVSTDLLNNVYDLYGNSYEWTLGSSSGDNRTYRGGNWEYSDSASGWLFSWSPNDEPDWHSTRLVLYVL